MPIKLVISMEMLSAKDTNRQLRLYMPVSRKKVEATPAITAPLVKVSKVADSAQPRVSPNSNTKDVKIARVSNVHTAPVRNTRFQ